METKASSLSEYLLPPPSSLPFTDQKGSRCPAWVDLLRGRIASPPLKFQPHTEARVSTEVRIKSPVILAVCDQSDQRYEVDSTVQDSIQAYAEPRVYDIWIHGGSPQFATTEQTTITILEAISTHLRRPEIFPSQQMSVA